MGFFGNVKKKAIEAFTGESPGVQKYSGSSGRRVGSMGKYGGGSSGGFDASTYKPDHKPSGHVGSMSKAGAIGGGYDAVTKKAGMAPKPEGFGGLGGKVIGGAGKALDWMAERGNELNAPPKKTRGRAPRMSKEDSRLENMYDPLMNERSAPSKRVRSRVPRGSQPSGYDGSMDMFGVGNFGMGHEASESPAYERSEHRGRRKQKSKRARVYEDEDGDMMNMNHIPSSLRGMF
jgi:hypothetical protein